MALQALRLGFRALQPVAPDLAARVAARLFVLPPSYQLGPRERMSLASGERFTATLHDGRTVRAWSFGHGPAVYLVHGWGGAGAQFASFVPSLVTAGFRAVTFDAPGHAGQGPRWATLIDVAEGLRAVMDRVGEPAHAIIGHSMGAAATTWALTHGVRARRAVFLAPAADLRAASLKFAEKLSLPEDLRAAMQRNLEARVGVPWSELNVPRAARSMSAPLLVVHDRKDREVPYASGEAIARAWPRAELVSTEGLGHTRMLRDAGVITRVVEFVGGVEERPGL